MSVVPNLLPITLIVHKRVDFPKLRQATKTRGLVRKRAVANFSMDISPYLFGSSAVFKNWSSSSVSRFSFCTDCLFSEMSERRWKKNMWLWVMMSPDSLPSLFRRYSPVTWLSLIDDDAWMHHVLPTRNSKPHSRLPRPWKLLPLLEINLYGHSFLMVSSILLLLTDNEKRGCFFASDQKVHPCARHWLFSFGFLQKAKKNRVTQDRAMICFASPKR